MSEGLDRFMRPDAAKTPAVEGESNVVPLSPEEVRVTDSHGTYLGTAPNQEAARRMIAEHLEQEREAA